LQQLENIFEANYLIFSGNLLSIHKLFKVSSISQSENITQGL